MAQLHFTMLHRSALSICKSFRRYPFNKKNHCLQTHRSPPAAMAPFIFFEPHRRYSLTHAAFPSFSHASIRLTGHRLACQCAGVARFGAALTRVVIMLSAFLSASFAYLRTNHTDLLRIRAVQRHRLGGEGANLRAFPAEAYACLQHAGMVFLQASLVTMIAGHHSLQAFFHTTLYLFG
ncbi:hypothetical protein ACFOSW_32655 [Paenibacillus sp. GCM10012303]